MNRKVEDDMGEARGIRRKGRNNVNIIFINEILK